MLYSGRISPFLVKSSILTDAQIKFVSFFWGHAMSIIPNFNHVVLFFYLPILLGGQSFAKGHRYRHEFCIGVIRIRYQLSYGGGNLVVEFQAKFVNYPPLYSHRIGMAS